MIKVVVAEDKHPILWNIVKKIENYSADLEVVGQATDGVTALETILRFKPAIVFTDIKMPGMDGLALITEVKKHLPDTIIIIISGHDEFEYARQAMKLGVTEYLLKPVTQDSMNEVLIKAIDLVKASRQTKENNTLMHIIKGGISPSICVDYKDLPYDSYTAMLICAGPISKFLIDIANPLHDFWLKTDLASFLSYQLPQLEPFWVYEGDAINEVIVIFSCSSKKEINFQAITDVILQHFKSSEIPFTIAISNRVSKVNDLKLEYQVTRATLRKHALFGRSKILYVKKMSLTSPSELAPHHSFDEQKLLSLVKNNKRELFHLEIQSLLRQWEKLEFTQSAIEFNLTQIVLICSKGNTDHSISNSDLKLELDEIISISKDYPSLIKNISFLYDHFFSSSDCIEPDTNTMRSIIERVEEYFTEHLSEEIFMSEIADMVNLNVTYLSREFKKYKGTAPIEYLTQLRINKAKHLLTDSSNLKFKDIAMIVGYQNQYYFSKVFKLITGMTPTEFKSARVRH